MKSLIILVQLLSSIYLVNCFINPLGDLAKLTQFQLDILKDLLSAADHVPQALTGFSLVDCPAREDPPTDFAWEDFKGTWYEIERTALFEILETGQKCSKITFAEESGQYKLNTTVVSTILNKPITDTKTLTIKDSPNVFSIHTSLFEETQYWIVDTDLDSYSLIFSCKKFLQASLRNAWILGRKSEIDQSTRSLLVKKLGLLGIPESSLIKSDQSCSSITPIV